MKPESLPNFKYHPDPLATGSIEPCDTECVCCGRSRGYIYTGSVYAEEDLKDALCPWCIADGSAAEEFDAEFSDGEPLAAANVPDEIVEEVTRRTPGYTSWQQEEWLACCRDACEFHGDASLDDLQSLQGDSLALALIDWNWRDVDWLPFLQTYKPGGNPAVYKFVCRHCRAVRYGVDFT